MESYGATDAQIDKSQFSNNLKINGKFCKNMFAKLHSSQISLYLWLLVFPCLQTDCKVDLLNALNGNR